MDEILYLEPDEEITSVIDKLKKSGTGSVGLVIPRNATLIHSIVNLKLLKKEAESLDKEIALVTADKIGKNIASQVGIQVYEDVHAKKPISALGMPELPKGDEVIEVDMSGGVEADALPAKPAEKSSGGPKIKHYSGDFSNKPIDKVTDSETDEMSSRMVASDYESGSATAAHITSKPMKDNGPTYQFNKDGRSNKGLMIFLGIFLAIILTTLLVLPQTAIELTVAAEPFEKAIPITIDKTAVSVNATDHIVPGKLLELTNDDVKRVVATGKKDVGGKASGTVTLSNGWQSEPYKISAGTTLTSSQDNKTLTLDSDATIPGVTLTLTGGQLVTTPGTVNAKITATNPGDTFNVKAGNFTVGGLSAKQQEKITASSSKDFSGGFTKTVTVMTQADIDGAKDSLAADLNKEALDQLKKDARNLKLVNEAVVNATVSAESNPSKPDTETDYFDLKVKVKHQAIVFDEKAVQSIVDAVLKADVPADKELLLGEGDEFVIDVQGSDYEKGRLELESKVKTKIGSRVDAVKAKQGINGKSEKAIRAQLSTIPNVKDIHLYKFPRWWWQDTSIAPWNTHLKVIYE